MGGGKGRGVVTCFSVCVTGRSKHTQSETDREGGQCSDKQLDRKLSTQLHMRERERESRWVNSPHMNVI